MYSTELRRPGWESMPPLLKVILLGGILVGVGGLVAAGVASADARDANRQAQQAADRANAAIERVEQEGLERDYELCSNSNEARAGILRFITGLVVEDGTDTVTEGEQVVLDFAAETFGPQECPPDPSP